MILEDPLEAPADAILRDPRARPVPARIAYERSLGRFDASVESTYSIFVVISAASAQRTGSQRQARGIRASYIP